MRFTVNATLLNLTFSQKTQNISDNQSEIDSSKLLQQKYRHLEVHIIILLQPLG